MNKFSWSIFVTLSMILIGTNILIYHHHPDEILQFVGGWLLVGGVGILLLSVFFEQFLDLADRIAAMEPSQRFPGIRGWVRKRAHRS